MRALVAAQGGNGSGAGEEPPMGTDGMPIHKHELAPPADADADADAAG